MPKAYLIAFYSEVKDSDALAAYAKLAIPATEADGGRMLAAGGRVKSLEGGIEERTVVIEFDDFETAVKHYDSDGYQEALRALGDGVVRDMRVVEALE